MANVIIYPESIVNVLEVDVIVCLDRTIWKTFLKSSKCQTKDLE